jgi:AraC-like DNA-binding protein
MLTERSIVTREELFEPPWKSSLRDVARRLHLAPALLMRVCRQVTFSSASVVPRNARASSSPKSVGR